MQNLHRESLLCLSRMCGEEGFNQRTTLRYSLAGEQEGEHMDVLPAHGNSRGGRNSHPGNHSLKCPLCVTGAGRTQGGGHILHRKDSNS